MKSADCPFGAAARLRARMAPPPPPMTLPADVQRVMKRLAIAVGFACGCWLGITWPPASDAWHALVPIVAKWSPLIAGPLVLARRPGRRGYEASGGQTWSRRTVRWWNP